jgi:uncharacterized repeat protein (TIGR03803 family)
VILFAFLVAFLIILTPWARAQAPIFTNFVTLHSFAASDGEYPRGALTAGTDGNIYGTTSEGGTIFKITPGGAFTVLVDLGEVAAIPDGGLIEGSNGNFYGTTPGGGASNDGTVYGMTTTGSLTTLCSFSGTNGSSPLGSLVQASNGNFYGTTAQGGVGSNGAVFQVTPAGSLTLLCTFSGTNGQYPMSSLVVGADGNLYGTTTEAAAYGSGTVFQATPGGALNTLYAFPAGSYPSGLVQGADGNFYGTVEGNGQNNYYGGVFKITPGGVESIVCPFTALNNASECALALGNDGNFYGVTTAGGSNESGTVFMVTPGGALTTLYTFSGQDGLWPDAALMLGSDGNFYGTTSAGGTHSYGTIFKLVPSAFTTGTAAGFNYQILASNNPTGYGASGLPAGLSVNGATGLISGTPTATGTFAVSVSAANASGTASETVTILVLPTPNINSGLTATGTTGGLFNYQIAAAGSPTSYNASNLPPGLALNSSSGLISGTPTATGTFGVPISATITNGAYVVTGSATLTISVIAEPMPAFINLVTLHSFSGTDGEGPQATLTQGSDGALYGTTVEIAGGVIFKITTGGAFTTLDYSAYARGGFIEGNDGNLYGTNTAGPGEVFSMTTSGQITGLGAIGPANGLGPLAQLLQASDGNFYGTASSGGANNDGTVFEATPDGTVTTVCSFTGTNGKDPSSKLIEGSDGNLYGTTPEGGAYNEGTVFEITLGGGLTTLYSFPGAGPSGGLVQGMDGNFYGTDSTSVFKITPGEVALTVCGFNDATGIGADGLALGNDGNFYGTSPFGGSSACGTIYMATQSGSLSVLYTFSGNDGEWPNGPLFLANDGNFYGTTGLGGANGDGTVFKFIPSAFATGTTSGFTYQILASNNPTGYGASGLPAGLSLNSSTGLISGTPAATGTFSVSIGATNTSGTATESISILVLPTPVITSGSTAAGVAGAAFNYQIAATGTPASYNAAFLPQGLVVNPSSGLISGTPTASGTFWVPITATITNGAFALTGSGTLAITVQSAYSGWKSQMFTAAQLADPTISGDMANPAGDGIPNLMKYALGLNPNVNCGGTPAGFPCLGVATSGSNQFLTLTFTGVASDVTYSVQATSDPNGKWCTVYTSTPGQAPGTIVVSDTVPMGCAPARFMHLKVCE